MNRSKLGVALLVGALICGALAAYLVSYYIQRQVDKQRAEIRARYEPVDVIVARKNLEPGTVLSGNTVARRGVPRAYVSNDAIRAQNWENYTGRTLAVEIASGDTIQKSSLGSKFGRSLTQLFGQNRRAFTISLDDESTLSGMLRPSDRVDLILTLGGEEGGTTFPLVTDVKVLATGGATRLRRVRRQGKNQFSKITVALKPRIAARVTHAQSIGRLHVQLRSENSTETPHYAVTQSSILGNKGKDKGPVKMVIGGTH